MRSPLWLAPLVAISHIFATLAPCPSAVGQGVNLGGGSPVTAVRVEHRVDGGGLAHVVSEHADRATHPDLSGQHVGMHGTDHEAKQVARFAGHHAAESQAPDHVTASDHYADATSDTGPQRGSALKAPCRCGCDGAPTTEISARVALGKMLVTQPASSLVVSASRVFPRFELDVPPLHLREVDHVPIAA